MKVNYLGPGATSQATERKREIRRLAARTPLGDSSITRPGKRLRVGPEGVGGTLNADGTMDWAGIVRFVGEFSQTGPSVFDGDVAISRTLDVTAETTLRELVTLLSDLRVEGVGKIDLGGIVLEPSEVGGGAINFNPTGSIFAGLGSLGIIPPDLSVMLTLADGRATVAGDIRAAEGLQAMNLPEPPPDTPTTPVVVDVDGNFYRAPTV